MRWRTTTALGLGLIALAACDTTASYTPYAASAANGLAIREAAKAGDAKVSLAQFPAAAGDPTLRCRGGAQLDMTGGKTFGQYVHDALETELVGAGIYDANAPVLVQGRLEAVRIDKFATGSWELAMSVASNRDPAGYRVAVHRNFSTDYMATATCRDAVRAFVPTVQALIGAVVAHPDFPKLIGRE
jgi:hypothetical protein